MSSCENQGLFQGLPLSVALCTYLLSSELAKEGKNPFQLDSKAPQWDKFQDYLMGEVRFASLKKGFPAEADELYAETEKAAKRRYQSYVRKSQEDWSEEI